MADKSSLGMIDELDKITQDFLSELTDMESKRGGPSTDMESKRSCLSTDMESKKLGTSSDMESKRSGLSTDMESKKGGTSSDTENKRSGLSTDMESKKGGTSSDMESKRCSTSKKEIVIEQPDMTDSAAEKGSSTSDGPMDAEQYYKKNSRRGECLIFVHEKYFKPEGKTVYEERSSARVDCEVCEGAFKALNFDVKVFKDLKKKDLRAELEKASTRDHSDCDALAVVFMSHGETDNGREKLVTYDGTINTAELWGRLAQCPSLLGKPKLFFIQACRGGGFEQSVGLKVSTDSSSLPEPLAKWSLGFDSPDMLVMQSSYEGKFSFRTMRKGIVGSVFIHFLAQIFKDKGRQNDLSELLLEVTRRVALDYEAVAKDERYNKAKQMPLTRSTLTKKVTFAEV